MMLTTAAALSPAALWGVYQFGVNALLLVLAGVLGAVVTEGALNFIKNEKLSVTNGHALLVGLVLALLMPAGAPPWMALLGGVLAILVGKAPFGPLGGAPLSPALVGLLIIGISWPAGVGSYEYPTSAAGTVEVHNPAPAESPVEAFIADPSDAAEYSPTGLFLGNQVAQTGCASPLLLLLGGLFLMLRKVSRWQAPAGYLLGVAVFAFVMNGVDPGAYATAEFHLFTGAAMLGAFFLTTEMVCTPVTPKGMFFFGLLAGVLTVLFRMTGVPFGRVAFAILIAQLATPLLDRLAQAPFGKVVTHA